MLHKNITIFFSSASETKYGNRMYNINVFVCIRDDNIGTKGYF